jgi:hypothetical protein
MCTITGWLTLSQDPFDGGVGNPTTNSGFEINYVGGVPISSFDGNPIVTGKWLFLHKPQTGLAEDIQWMPEFDLVSYTGCTVSYEGKQYKGYVGGSVGFPGTMTQTCSVDFGCEGNLPQF